MTAAGVWLLISLGFEMSRTSTPTVKVDSFRSQAQCEQVRKDILDSVPSEKPRLVCVEVRP